MPSQAVGFWPIDPKSPSPCPLEAARGELLSPGLSHLVGVSGGRDSMALFHWLLDLGCRDLVVCHFNHGLREEASDGDEAFVRDAAAEAGVAFVSRKNDTREFAGKSGQSLETAARESRYRFFAAIARERDCQRIVLAHHADDQVETVVMNLFRGTGLAGLGGMKAVSRREIGGVSLEIIRPLLRVRRREIDAYCSLHGIAYRDDPTNREPVATRNRIRHQLLPLAEEIFRRDPAGAVLRLSEIAEAEAAASFERASRWLKTWREADGGLPLKELRTLPPADLNQTLHLWLKDGEVPDCGFDEIRSIAAMIHSRGRPAKVNLPGNIHARRRSGSLFLSRGND